MIWILSKYLVYIWLFFSTAVLAQQEGSGSNSYEEYRKSYRYVREKKYKGPDGDNYVSPASMEEVSDPGNSSGGNGGLNYSPQSIQKSRQVKKKNTTDRGGSTGTKPYDPKITEPERPSVDEPDLDMPSVETPDATIPPMVWKVILFLLGFILLAIIVYLIAKNYRPRNVFVPTSFSPEDWNPELIPKTELELRLEAAIAREDYRECVRIYFTFILKELIRLRKIRWKKDYTNFDYLIQVFGKPEQGDFEETVRIYDLIWYGEYEITATEYAAVLPHLEKHYKQLSAAHE